MKVTIKSTDNGFVAKTNDMELVFESINDDDKKEAFSTMCRWLWEDNFGSYDKYGSENIRITFDKKGHKV